jgi:hypothetical protein
MTTQGYDWNILFLRFFFIYILFLEENPHYSLTYYIISRLSTQSNVIYLGQLFFKLSMRNLLNQGQNGQLSSKRYFFKEENYITFHTLPFTILSKHFSLPSPYTIGLHLLQTLSITNFHFFMESPNLSNK